MSRSTCTFTHVNNMLQFFSTDLLIGEIYHKMCHINIILCVKANFLPVFSITLNYIQRLQMEFCFWLVLFFFLLFALIWFILRSSKCTSLGWFYDKLTKYMAEKICKVINEINVYRKRRAGMWCLLADYSLCVETKGKGRMAWRGKGVVTLPPHLRKWGFHGTRVTTWEYVDTGNESWDKQIKTAILEASFHTLLNWM